MEPGSIGKADQAGSFGPHAAEVSQMEVTNPTRRSTCALANVLGARRAAGVTLPTRCLEDPVTGVTTFSGLQTYSMAFS
jgi:hypothetical protein